MSTDLHILANRIRTLDSGGLLRLAAAVLGRELGVTAEICDGPYDHGSDIRLHGHPAEPTWVVQCKAGRRWEQELRAETARMAPGTTVVWCTTERVSEDARVRLEAAVLRPRRLQIQWYDGRRLAALAGHYDLTALIGEASATELHREPLSLAERTAMTIALLSDDAAQLRRDVEDAAVLEVVHLAGDVAEVSDVVVRARDRLGLHASADTRLRGAVDRLRQQGRLGGSNGTTSLPAPERDRLEQALRTTNALRDQLRANLTSAVADALPRPSTEQIQAVVDLAMRCAGPLALEWAHRVQHGLRAGHAGLHGRVEDRLRQLRLDLAALDLPDADALLTCVLAVLESSPLVSNLICGEVWRLTATLPRRGVLDVLGRGDQEPVVLLDANVAMPMLLSLEYHAPSLRFFRTAQHTHHQLVRLGLRAAVPEPWLEEMASQLADAVRFQPLIGSDPDLALSHNLFVAFFVGQARDPSTFRAFVAGLGLPERQQHADFVVARDAAMRGLERLLAEHHITVQHDIAPADRRAEEQVRYAARAMGEDARTELTLPERHDAAVIASLAHRAAPPTIICTWHRLLHEVAATTEDGWQAVDPSALADLLSLASDGDSFEPHGLTAAWMAMDEASRARGARVWDMIVRSERAGLENGALRTLARSFKDHWIQRRLADVSEAQLIREWEAWKRAGAGAPPSP